jgi:hypothetical protein
MVILDNYVHIPFYPFCYYKLDIAKSYHHLKASLLEENVFYIVHIPKHVQFGTRQFLIAFLLYQLQCLMALVHKSKNKRDPSIGY